MCAKNNLRLERWRRVIRIIGIDPGYAIVGYGVIDYQGNRFKVMDYGAITTEANTPFPDRLLDIWQQLGKVLDRYSPEEMAIEKIFFSNNRSTAIDVAQARGVLMLGAVERGIPVAEYTPRAIKQAVVGYGNAEKSQMQFMTKTILGLSSTPKPDDVADALAVAICHAHCASSQISAYI